MPSLDTNVVSITHGHLTQMKTGPEPRLSDVTYPSHSSAQCCYCCGFENNWNLEKFLFRGTKNRWQSECFKITAYLTDNSCVYVRATSTFGVKIRL
jgi:hypothetical protein